MLYLADRETLFNIVRHIDESYQRVVLIGHNEGITELANHLQGNVIDNIPTLGVVKVSFKAKKWSEISANSGKLESFIYPKNMNKTLKKFLPILGPLFSIFIWSSSILPPEMRGLGGVMVWVIWWWLFTEISLHITGLLGVSFAVFIGVEKAATAYASFANPLIFLFMGLFYCKSNGSK